MKKTIIFLVLVFFGGALLSQNYKIEDKTIAIKEDAKKYEIKISYPQIKRLNTSSEEGFNTLVKGRMEAERDSFIVWMKDWEINEFNKDFSSEYEISDLVQFNDSKLISVHFSVYSYLQLRS